MSFAKVSIAAVVKFLKSYSAVKAVFANLLLMAGGAFAVAGAALGILTLAGHGSYGVMGMVFAAIGAVAGLVASVMLKLEFKFASFHYSR